MSISALKQYQRPRGAGRFADLPPDQRAEAEGHYQRLCAKWRDDLPQWRKAILVGRAKDLVLRPRDTGWGRALRKGRRRQPPAPAVSTSTAPVPPPLQPASATPPSDARASPTAQVASSTEAVRVASPRAPAKMVSSPARTNAASSLSEPSTLPPPSPHAVRLDVRGLTASGRDGADTARRLLHDLERRAFGESPHFSIAVPEKDLPPGWAWRLEVVPVS